MFRIKLRNYFLLTIIIILFFAQISLSTSAAEQILKIGYDASDIHTMNIWDTMQAQDAIIRTAVFEKLVDYRIPGQVSEDMVPELAVSWEHSDDFKVWTFKLREGVQFHKGYGEMTAEDVKFSIDQMRNPDIGSSASQPIFSNIKEVSILEKYTIQIVLENSDARYIGKIGQDGRISVTSKKAYEELGDDLKINPIGTGPFEFDEYRPMEYSKVVRFDDYWGDKKAKLDAFIVYYMPDIIARNIATKNGDLHMIRGVFDSMWKIEMEQAGLITDSTGPGTSSMLFFNPRIKPLDNKLIREAICYAINREEIAMFFGAGSFPQISPVPSAWLFHTTEGIPRYDYDPEKAKEKLVEAGYSDGLTIGPQYVSEASYFQNTFNIIQAQLAEVGINLEITMVDHTTYHNNQYEGIQPLPFYGNNNYDGQDLFFSFFHTSSGRLNFADYHEIDGLLDSSIGKSFEEINEIIIKAQQKVMEDLVVYPTIEKGNSLARRPEVVLGYEPKSTLTTGYTITVDTHLE